MLASLTGGLAIDYFFETPPADVWVSSPRTILQVLLLLLIALLVTALASARRARGRAESGRATAEAAVRLRSEALAGIAHDLKRPLTFMLLSAQILEEEAQRLGSAEGHALAVGLARISARGSRMLGLINELLDVARLQIGEPLALRRRPTDLVLLAQHAADEYQREAELHHIQVHATVSQLLGSWDAERIQRVLDNLLSNAIKYSPNGGLILVEVAAPQPGTAQLAVRDHGVGIAPEQRQSVFKRFHRAHGDKIAGAGLGLYVSQQIVTLHGGRIDVEAPADGGTRFVVTLPTDFRT
jgi:signal transduction histidine kinase